jgi:hypothetical protein
VLQVGLFVYEEAQEQNWPNNLEQNWPNKDNWTTQVKQIQTKQQ